MSMTNSLSPNVVLTALDDVFYQEFDRGRHPGYVDATSGLVFTQDSCDNAGVIMETFKGVSAWGEKEEVGLIPEESARTDNKKTYTMITFAKGVEISKEFFDDNMHGVYERTVRDFAVKAKIGRDVNAFKVYNGGFDTYVTADDSYIFATDHTTLSGATVSNAGTAVLTESSLDDAITALIEQKDQAGVVMGKMPNTLFVPPKLFKEAAIILDSDLRSATSNNDANIYSSKYSINLATSERIGAAGGGSDTAWFLLGMDMGISRWTREGLSTYLNDWRDTKNQAYFYAGRFREEVGAQDYVGLWGSDGSV